MTPYDYAVDFQVCSLTPNSEELLEIKSICNTMLVQQPTYWWVGKTVGVPWFIVAAIHYRESNQNFNCHLHNGDPLTDRTTHIPTGRPENGHPPFTWRESAIDALLSRFHPHHWSVGSVLQFCEQYNGLGYQKRGINSPYIWSFTDHYETGLFIADGTFDSEKRDKRPGIASLLKMLIQSGVVFDFENEVELQNVTLH